MKKILVVFLLLGILMASLCTGAIIVVSSNAQNLTSDLREWASKMSELDPTLLAAAVKKKRTVPGVIKEYGSAAKRRMRPSFKEAGVPYPPSKLTLVGLKEEKLLLVFAPDEDGNIKKLLSYPILAASGEAGPKLKQGDFQVPEGFYKLILLNPNSQYHLSLRVNYPNEEDTAHARKEKRTNLGGDIMIHGRDASIGCLAIGDEAIEEVFTLAHDTGLEKIDLILAPCDLTTTAATVDFEKQPSWLPALYKRLKKSLASLPIQKTDD